MVRIRIIHVGKLRNPNLSSELEEIRKRLDRVEFKELKEIKEKKIEVQKSKEAQQIISLLNPSSQIVLLSEQGKSYSTEEFTRFLKKAQRDIDFIISGPFGPSEELKKRADLILSLSPFTFTHEMALLLLTEQLYRAQCIEKGIPYHK